MGEIGPVRKEIIFEPIDEPADEPVPEVAPAEPDLVPA